ncbi:MAG: hypothetical protein ABIS67_10510, partial [Candidatus Eisenbacteria bacterium]
PPVGEVTCSHPRVLARPGALVPLAVVDFMTGGIVCLACALPLLHFAGPGFLEVFCTALATQVFLMVPAWRYRDTAPAREAATLVRARTAA